MELKNRIKLFFYLILLLASFNAYATDTLQITAVDTKIVIYKYISILEDPGNNASLEQILNSPQLYQFHENQVNKLNFEFSTSTFWFKIVVKNNAIQPVNYILEISNPDLDYISFYKVSYDTINYKIETGELFDVKTRQYYHRNFLFRISLNPNETGEYYLSINNLGHSLTIPLSFVKESNFSRASLKTEIINWMIFGLLLFIIIFNIYLYRSAKDKLYIYNSLIFLFAAIILLNYDGYFYLFNFPPIVEKIKWLYPSLYTVFLMSFTQEFTKTGTPVKGLKKIFNPFKIIALLIPFFYFIKYPVSVIADIGLPLIILISQILLIITAFKSLNKKYSPSVLLTVAFCIVFFGMLVHELKEMNVINLNFFVLNSLKLGLTLESILLTLAVLERFRINLEQAKETIENNYDKIEIQNKELEIINTELEKLSIVASETNNCVAIYDNTGRLEWCNTYFEEFYNTTFYDIIKSNKDYIFDIIFNARIKDLFNESLTTKAPVTFETQVRSKKKEEIWVQTTLSPLVRRDTVFKLVAIDSDITELKQYEKKLELAKTKAIESDRLKSVFLGNMSHEIRTPLNGILGFSELLTNSVVDEERRIKFLKMITTNGEQLLRIIDDIVDISLIESNQMRIDATTVNLNNFLQGIIDYFEAYKTTINKSSIALILENRIKSDEMNIIIDPGRLKQVLSNLINNGLKFTNEGSIRLTCSKLKNNLQFCVEDTGVGLDPAKKEIIFERFRQADERLNREHGGTGLGLSISKGIVEKMNGKIWIDSKEGNGLKICFYIPYLPIKKQRVDSIATAVKNVQVNINNKSILIVEDHDDSYELLIEVLAPQYSYIHRAHTGEEAVNMLRNTNFDLILMDINLPVLDGISATQEIRKFNKQVSIIAQTAYAMKIEKEKILASGCNDIISKPINFEDLFRLLKKYL